MPPFPSGEIFPQAAHRMTFYVLTCFLDSSSYVISIPLLHFLLACCFYPTNFEKLPQILSGRRQEVTLSTASLTGPAPHLLRVDSSKSFPTRAGLAQPPWQRGLEAARDPSSAPISPCCKRSHSPIPVLPRSKILLTLSWLHCHHRPFLKGSALPSQLPLRGLNHPLLVLLKKPSL